MPTRTASKGMKESVSSERPYSIGNVAKPLIEPAGQVELVTWIPRQI